MKCEHCRWFERLPTMLGWCALHLRFAEQACDKWTREPGADDDL